jgi:hypothetical protein
MAKEELSRYIVEIKKNERVQIVRREECVRKREN